MPTGQKGTHVPYMEKGGYRRAYSPAHSRADRQGYVYEHILVAERALGKPLPLGAEVHHVDENGLNNENRNIVICPSHTYHMLLHMRAQALRACGNPDLRRCFVCRVWDDPRNLQHRNTRSSYEHRECWNAYVHKRRRAHREDYNAQQRRWYRKKRIVLWLSYARGQKRQVNKVLIALQKRIAPTGN
jgi:hypothetical protein